MHPTWNWLTKTDQGLAARIAGGGLIFLVLALTDLHRRGRQATRWREYAFLLAAVAVAMVYGAINDLITSRISWEYFVYGKDLFDALGRRVPPDPWALAWESAKVGIKATWTAGLMIGAAMLIANNPSQHIRQLSYRQLLSMIPAVFLACMACGVALGIAGYHGWLTWCSADFPAMLREDQFRPRRFMAVFGIHLGGYVGGIAGTVGAVILIRRRRRATI